MVRLAHDATPGHWESTRARSDIGQRAAHGSTASTPAHADRTASAAISMLVSVDHRRHSIPALAPTGELAPERPRWPGRQRGRCGVGEGARAPASSDFAVEELTPSEADAALARRRRWRGKARTSPLSGPMSGTPT